MDRAQQRQAFLANSSFAGASLEALPVDASFRRYFRIRGGDRAALLMDSPPPEEDVWPFVAVAEHLQGLGLSAPRIYDRDTALGFLTLEDFGEDTYTRLLDAGTSERQLYELGLDTLVALHRHPQSAALSVPDYDRSLILQECTLFPEWFLPWLGIPSDEAVVQSHVETWGQIIDALPAPAESLVLRDYHVDNLMQLSGRTGVAACGLLDFQDARIGPTAYDVMSLLEDARRDLAAGLVDAVLERYVSAMQFDDESRSNFMTWYHVLAAQRHCRVLGVFVRLCERDGKGTYLKHQPRVARLLLSHMSRPELAPLQEWLDQYLGETLGTFAAGEQSQS